MQSDDLSTREEQVLEAVIRSFVETAEPAGSRTIAKKYNLGVSAATLGHRYALAMAGVDTVVLGVKNRAELADCLAAAETGPLPQDLVAQVDACFAVPSS